MNGKDRSLEMNYVSAKYIEEAEAVKCLKKWEPAAAAYLLRLSGRIRGMVQLLWLQSQQHKQIP